MLLHQTITFVHKLFTKRIPPEMDEFPLSLSLTQVRKAFRSGGRGCRTAVWQREQQRPEIKVRCACSSSILGTDIV